MHDIREDGGPLSAHIISAHFARPSRKGPLLRRDSFVLMSQWPQPAEILKKILFSY